MRDEHRTLELVKSAPTAHAGMAELDELAALRADLDRAAGRFNELARLSCSISFEKRPGGGVRIALRDRNGRVIRLLSGTEMLAIVAS